MNAKRKEYKDQVINRIPASENNVACESVSRSLLQKVGRLEKIRQWDHGITLCCTAERLGEYIGLEVWNLCQY